jgi:hypothetical protein
MFTMLRILFHADLALNFSRYLCLMIFQLAGDVSTWQWNIVYCNLALLLAWISANSRTLMLAAILCPWAALGSVPCLVLSKYSIPFAVVIHIRTLAC